MAEQVVFPYERLAASFAFERPQVLVEAGDVVDEPLFMIEPCRATFAMKRPLVLVHIVFVSLKVGHGVERFAADVTTKQSPVFVNRFNVHNGISFFEKFFVTNVTAEFSFRVISRRVTGGVPFEAESFWAKFATENHLLIIIVIVFKFNYNEFIVFCCFNFVISHHVIFQAAAFCKRKIANHADG